MSASRRQEARTGSARKGPLSEDECAGSQRKSGGSGGIFSGRRSITKNEGPPRRSFILPSAWSPFTMPRFAKMLRSAIPDKMPCLPDMSFFRGGADSHSRKAKPQSAPPPTAAKGPQRLRSWQASFAKWQATFAPFASLTKLASGALPPWIPWRGVSPQHPEPAETPAAM